ncbi:hypothetical protein C0Q70_19502 [Pomacea canaliculata]|uniref:Uncharacterized protein n=1 Tax=Pomacea canaliculata TaxID=400727 RepID=A0A2T7NJI7_POMCA|nr:hypothetical protein C0Q70_19502 [Pomacea canaliculata]
MDLPSHLKAQLEEREVNSNSAGRRHPKRTTSHSKTSAWRSVQTEGKSLMRPALPFSQPASDLWLRPDDELRALCPPPAVQLPGASHLLPPPFFLLPSPASRLHPPSARRTGWHRSAMEARVQHPRLGTAATILFGRVL